MILYHNKKIIRADLKRLVEERGGGVQIVSGIGSRQALIVEPVLTTDQGLGKDQIML